MFETVSVDEAIKRGKQTITYPVFVIMIGMWVLCFIAAASRYSGLPVIVAGIALSFILPWLYWSVMITRWRLWAFYNVRNVHELQKKAIKRQLIWPDGKFFNKTEIWTADQRAQWAALQDKFKQDDVFTDNAAIAPQTVIRFSKNKAIGAIIFGLVFLAGGTWLLLSQSDSAVAGYGGLFVGGILFFIGYRHLINREPQVILSNDGVQIAGAPFYSWQDITNEDTVIVRSGKSRRLYFKYNTPEGEKSIEINEFDVSTRDFENLLLLYRGRYTQKHK